MNRNFMSPDRGVQPAVRQRPQLGSLSTSSIKAKEEELALFLEMRRREKERNYIHNSEEFDAPLVAGSPTGFSQLFNIESATPARKNGGDDFLNSESARKNGGDDFLNSESAQKNGGDDFLNSESDKSDYEWLLTPPISPRFPPLERESPPTVTSSDESPNSRPTALESRVVNSQSGPTARSNLGPKQSPILFPSFNNNNNSSTSTRRLSSSGVPGSRSVTPNTRPTLTKSKSTPKPTPSTVDKPTSTTTSKTIPFIAAKPQLIRSSTPPPRSTTLSAKSTLPARSSTPPPRSTSLSAKSTLPARSSTPPRSTSLSAKSTLPARSSTPTRSSVSLMSKSTLPSKTSTPPVRSNARSSTPTARSTGPASNPTTRAPTPTRRPTNTCAPPIKSLTTSISAPPIRSLTTTNSVSPSNPSIVKPRTWKPSEMPGYSLDAPPNLRTSLPGRPVSATRGRVSAPNVRSSSVEPVPNGRVRRQSCSPSRGRAANVSGSSVPVTALGRLQAKAKDIMSPVLYGTKMVERMVNMRKLAPPKQDDKQSPHSNLSGKSSSSPDNPGFGRTLSKTSLDMAIRHMDIRQRVPGNPRPLTTNIQASSMYSVRMRSSQSKPISVFSVSDSPHATSSNVSSEMSVNNNAICFNGSQIDINSEDKGV